MDALKFEDFKYYTYDDYKEWEGLWELIDGVAYAKAPTPSPKHQRVVANVCKELDKNFECSNEVCEFYISPIDWKIDETTVVQPDVALFCEEPTKQYFTKTPPLVVEVLSKATAYKDVTVKFDLYQKEGVKFYIIIEPESEVADIFELEDSEYKLLKKCTNKDEFEFEIESNCKTKIDFAKVF